MDSARDIALRLHQEVEELRAQNARLRALLETAYRFISPNYSPTGQSATQMAAEIKRALEQKGPSDA